ncbi:MAG: hypothetical protein LAO77_06820 [Acidobacteriia bacterium]|nr:hypothetical protein [Terriglobia bacterium]
MIRKVLLMLACASLALVALPATAHASEFDQLTLLTFNHPVGLPHVTLPAGTYRFVLADPSGDRSVVKVMNEQGTTCYGTFLTIPEREAETPTAPVLLEKREAGAPQAIEAWFYPGDDIGREFLYPPEERFRG